MSDVDRSDFLGGLTNQKMGRNFQASISNPCCLQPVVFLLFTFWIQTSNSQKWLTATSGTPTPVVMARAPASGKESPDLLALLLLTRRHFKKGPTKHISKDIHNQQPEKELFGALRQGSGNNNGMTGSVIQTMIKMDYRSQHTSHGEPLMEWHLNCFDIQSVVQRDDVTDYRFSIRIPPTECGIHPHTLY